MQNDTSGGGSFSSQQHQSTFERPLPQPLHRQQVVVQHDTVQRLERDLHTNSRLIAEATQKKMTVSDQYFVALDEHPEDPAMAQDLLGKRRTAENKLKALLKRKKSLDEQLKQAKLSERVGPPNGGNSGERSRSAGDSQAPAFSQGQSAPSDVWNGSRKP